LKITNEDLIWNYGATFFRIASSVLLLPLILRVMPAETVGIWTVFLTITAFINLLDLGFNPTFARNVTYVFSGVKELKKNGYVIVNTNEKISVDYSILKGLIQAMRWFYSRVSILILIILITIGTYYIKHLLNDYHGDKNEVYIAWVIFCLISTYNLYSLYYDSLLQGKGLIKRSKQIIITGNVTYLVCASILILLDFDLIAIVAARGLSVIIIRYLSYYSFFTNQLIKILNNTKGENEKEILKKVYPNAIKIGLTSIGVFFMQKSTIIIGSLYLTLEEIASYGITFQLITVIASLSSIYLATYYPKISKFRIEGNIHGIKSIYDKSRIVLILTFLSGGLILLIFGDFAIAFIKSNTLLLPGYLIFLALILSLIEQNTSIAEMVLLTKNYVPFYKANLITGGIIVLGLNIALGWFKIGVTALIILPLLIYCLYQGWKWPYEVFKDLKVRR